MVVDDNRSDPLVTFTCEILSYIGKIMRFCENVLPFIKTTNNDMALGQYFNVIHSTCKYFEKVVVDNEVFHVKLNDPPKKPSYRKGWTYY